MTPLIREMVTLSPEPESAMWFDVGQSQRIEAMHVPAEVLMHPPFPRTAIVGIDSAGVKFALWVMAGDHSVTIGGVNAGQKYLTPFAVFETPEGLRYYRGDLEIDRATVNTTLRVVLGSLIKIKDASEGHRATAAKSPTNARRTPQGTPPPAYDRHTVKLEKSSQASEPQGGTHATPRRHQCRGHWRNCKSGKRVWVKDCWRGDASKGTVFKDYEVKQ